MSGERRQRGLPLLVLGFFAAVGATGCGTFGSPGESPAVAPVGMTPSRMELVFAEQVDAIEGPSGAIRTQIDGINVYLISDPANDRMRIIAPIARLEQVGARVMPRLLQANFHSALDARYAVSDGVIYSLYLHPISSLTPDQIASALKQVVSLYTTFGSTFSSGGLEFGAPGEQN